VADCEPFASGSSRDASTISGLSLCRYEGKPIRKLLARERAGRKAPAPVRMNADRTWKVGLFEGSRQVLQGEEGNPGARLRHESQRTVEYPIRLR